MQLLDVAVMAGAVLLISLWTACAVTAYRKAGRGGWWWVAFTIHAVSREGDRAIFAPTPADALPGKTSPKPGKPFTAAPGLLRQAQSVKIPG